MTVFVLGSDDGYQGFSPPFGVFETLDAAIAAYRAWASKYEGADKTANMELREGCYGQRMWRSADDRWLCVWEHEVGTLYLK